MFFLKRFLFVSICFFFAAGATAQSSDEFNLDEVYTIDADGTISLNSNDAEVTVVGSDRSDIRVEVHYKLDVSGFSLGSRNKFDMEVREENGNLVLEEQPRDFSGITIGSIDEEYTIRIEAPRAVSLDFDGDDEDYELRQIDGRIHISADDASVELTACKGNDFRFDLDDGSIEMDQGQGSLDIDVDDGQADILNGHFSSINLDSDDGDFRISTALTDGGNYRFDMDDGDLELLILGGGGTFNIFHNNADISVDSAFEQRVTEENESGYVLGNGSASVRIDVDDANIKLRKLN